LRESVKDKKTLVEKSILDQQKHLNKLPADERMFSQIQRKFVVNEKIYSYYNNLEGSILDLGCGGGFLSRNLIKNNKITKVYGLDIDLESEIDLKDIIENPRFNFIHSDIDNINAIFQKRSIDYLVSRDVFMFIENTQKYFDDVTNIVTSGIKHMGWYIEGNKRMKNNLLPEQIAEEYIKRGWEVELEYLDWYKSGYFINAYK